MHENRNLLLPGFRFCHSIKVNTLYCCVIAVIGSRAALLASCSGVILKICSFSSFISRAEAITAATPSFCRSTCFVVQPACVRFFSSSYCITTTCWKKRGLDVDSAGKKISRNKMKGTKAVCCCFVLTCVVFYLLLNRFVLQLVLDWQFSLLPSPDWCL